MSHYLHQLFVSSGILGPAAPTLTNNQGHAISTPALEEISEERTAPPVGTAAGSTGSPPAPQPFQPLRSAIRDRLDTQPPTPSKSDATESGVIEIGRSSTDQAPDTARTEDNIVATSSASMPLPPAASVGNKKQSSPAGQEFPIALEKQEASTPAPTLPSQDELIEHVFRWVGENPRNVVPAALSKATKSTEPQKTQKQPAPAQTAPQPDPVPAPFQIIPNTGHIPPAPAPARNRPHPPVAENDTRETSVEISIGTLQIQVEAPPATAAKPAHRPAAPRTNTRRPAAAAQPPAIDINRLRRGFYL